MRGKRFDQRMNQQFRTRKRTTMHKPSNEERGLALIGKRFGDLVVLRRSRSGIPGAWIAKCDCGKLAMVYDYLLKSGDTTSCGCSSVTEELSV
jgi:hypothetical protein